MAEIIDVANWLFTTRKIDLTVDDKVKFGWIFNRFLAKKYPEQAALLNHKQQDLGLILDLWKVYLAGDPYPTWLWSKSPKEKDPLSKEESLYLCRLWDLNLRDLSFVLDKFPEEIDIALKYWKKQQKL